MKNNRVVSRDINKTFLKQKVTIFGWLVKKIKTSKLVFLTLRDGYGFCYLVIDRNNTELMLQITNLTKESVISVTGIVNYKKPNQNDNKTEDFELWVEQLRVINYSQLTPFMINDNTDGQEKIRLKYRYLDLRRPIMQKRMWMRHSVLQEIRTFFHQKKNFIELETPILSIPTIEGANNFLVESSATKKHYFALPQSPQLYKQLLMSSGFPGYFQIARCFRDEDLRNNRQPEFTQLDLEINFATSATVISFLETLIILLWKKFRSSLVTSEFLKMDYFIAWNKYGTDKPDLRYQLFLEEYKLSSTKLIKDLNNEIIKGIRFKYDFSKTHWKELQNEIQKITKISLLFIFYFDKKLETNLNEKQKEEILSFLNVEKKEHWIGFCASRQLTNTVLGKVRVLLADYFQLTVNQPDKFCWIINQPMFEFSSFKQKYVATHHPFCQPRDVSLFEKDWKNSQADAYDLVINGEEIGSGSVRIHDLKIQQQVFQILGFDQEKMNNEFGFFLKAMEYGFPNHAGFALGIERLIAILMNTNSIRDVVPFPKTSKGSCLLTQSPKKHF